MKNHLLQWSLLAAISFSTINTFAVTMGTLSNNDTPKSASGQSGDMSFLKDIDGMQDNDIQSVQRSKSTGLAIQFVAPSSSFALDQADPKATVAQMNYFSTISGKYFLGHPELKGGLMAHILIFPSYKKPFQIPTDGVTDAKSLAGIKKTNEFIKKNTRCNSQGFCSFSMLDKVKYYPLNPKNELNVEDFLKFSNDYAKNDKSSKEVPDIYTQSKEHTYPIEIYVFAGTNGYLFQPNEIIEKVNELRAQEQRQYQDRENNQ
jgi:hypothetical protein